MKTILAILALSFILIGCSDSKESIGFTAGVVTSIGDYSFKHGNFFVLVDTTGNGVADISCQSDFAKTSFGHFKNHGFVGYEVDVEIFADSTRCEYEYSAHLRTQKRPRPKSSTEM